MIKNIFLFIFLLLNLNLYASLITQEGYDEFLIGKTSLASMYEKYPEKKYVVYNLTDSTKTVSIKFIEAGIELDFTYNILKKPNEVFLDKIDIIAPCKGKTEKNIGIGSNMRTMFNEYDLMIPYGGAKYKKRKYLTYSFLIDNWMYISICKGKVVRISIISH